MPTSSSTSSFSEEPPITINKIEALRAYATAEKEKRDNFEFKLYPEKDNDNVYTFVNKQKRQSQFDSTNLDIYHRLIRLTHEMDALKTKASSSKLPRIKFANLKVLDECCDVTETAVKSYFEHQQASFTYLTAKRSLDSNPFTMETQDTVDEKYQALKAARNKAADAIRALDIKSNTLPSSRIMKRMGIAMMALGLALLVGGLICFGLSIGSAIFAPPISAILGMVGVSSILTGAGSLIVGSITFVSRHQKDTGINAIKDVSSLLTKQNLELSHVCKLNHQKNH